VAAVTAAVAAPLQNAGTTTSSLLPAAISPAIPRTTAAAVPVAAAAGSAVSPLTVVGRVVQGTQTTVGRQLLAGPVAPPTTAEQAGFATTADGPVLQPGGLVSATAAPPLLEAGPLGEPPQPGTTSAGSFLFGALAGLVPALLPGWSAPGAAPVPTAGAPYGAIAEAQGANAPPGPAQPAVPGGAAASAGAGIALLLTLAGLMLLWVPPAVRRLRLASESLRLAPWVLIPERPG
jgi:hypothetical protein